MKTLKSLLPVLFLVAGLCGPTSAQDAKKSATADQAAQLKRMADDQRLVFKAEFVNVTGGQTAPKAYFFNSKKPGPDNHITLTGDYSLKLEPQQVSSFLALFDDDFYHRPPGDTYINPTIKGVGFKYATASYNYAVKQLKSGDIEITVLPQNDTHVKKFFLEIAPSGKAILTLTDGRDHTITYGGSVTAQI